MVMATTQRRYTVAEVLAFPPDGNRYEVIHGELFVSPAPRPLHQAVIVRLVNGLSAYLEAHGRGDTLFTAPADISWDDETLVQPDILVVPPDEVTNDWSTYKTLLLAVEVISPSSGRVDRVIKRALYQERGVATYWIVDPEAQLVEVWQHGDERPAVMTERLQWRVTPDAPDLAIDLATLFRALPR
jgi:Uma2 family endonuclease